MDDGGDFMLTREELFKAAIWGQKRRKSSISLDENFLSQVTEESIVHH